MESWGFILVAIGFMIAGVYIQVYFNRKRNRLMFLSSYFSLLIEYGYISDENLSNYAYSIKAYSKKSSKNLYHDSYKKYIKYIDRISSDYINESTFKTLYYFSHCMIIDAILNIYTYTNEPSSLDERYISLFEISIKKIAISDDMYDSHKKIGLQDTRDRIEKAIEFTLCNYL